MRRNCGSIQLTLIIFSPAKPVFSPALKLSFYNKVLRWISWLNKQWLLKPNILISFRAFCKSPAARQTDDNFVYYEQNEQSKHQRWHTALNPKHDVASTKRFRRENKRGVLKLPIKESVQLQPPPFLPLGPPNRSRSNPALLSPIDISGVERVTSINRLLSGRLPLGEKLRSCYQEHFLPFKHWSTLF